MSDRISGDKIKAILAAAIGLGVGYLSYSLFETKDKPLKTSENLDNYFREIDYNEEYEEIVRE